MVSVRVISSNIIKAPPSNNDCGSIRKIELTPWELSFVTYGSVQSGLLYDQPINTPNQIEHLKQSFSSTLSFFPPFTGRLMITQHEDNTSSFSITCNNAGALFVHAKAENTSVADILGPKYVPTIVQSFFAPNGVINYKGTSEPLLAVQVTELVDGMFIGFTVNHVTADGKAFWHFFNSWAEISRGCDKISKLPSFEHWFPDGVDCPIRFPFKMSMEEEKRQSENISQPERVFHFTKEKIQKLKVKANAEANTNKISSLQALITLIWRSVVRSKGVEPQEDVHSIVMMDFRHRVVPPLPENFFGVAALDSSFTMKAGELLGEGGFGKGALRMNEMVASYTDEKVRSLYESWLKKPRTFTLGNMTGSNNLVTSCSHRFDFFGNDFGWGKPVAVRNGIANKRNGKLIVYAGAEEGSIDIEVCLPIEILEGMGNDPDILDAISN